jgi:ketosteroid isomerase-like protein
MYMKSKMAAKTARAERLIPAVLLCAALLLGWACPVRAQQKDKKNKKDAPASDTSPTTSLLPDQQQIDYQISTMLGAWQVGDVEKLHQTYADDAVIVSGSWGPPIIGWANYAPVYQQLRGRMSQVRMDRSNTYIKVDGNVAWACYQWDFSAAIDGQVSGSQGLATLIFEKRDGRWLIVHNHTAMLRAAQPSTPAGPGNAPSAIQPTASSPGPR